MSEHLVDLATTVDPPDYVRKDPSINLSSLFSSGSRDAAKGNASLLTALPKMSAADLDESQLRALQRVLTKKLAIIQGPPGTGKTYVSTVALRALASEMTESDPPLIIASQTNHALDQLLRHVAQFEDNFVRLGGRTLDQDVVKMHTLYELRKVKKLPPVTGGLQGPAAGRIRRCAGKMAAYLEPFYEQKEPMSAELLHRIGLLTEAQFKSLEQGATGWVRAMDTGQPSGSIATWLGPNLVRVTRNRLAEDFVFDYEESDPEYEQLKEMEAEMKVDDDENADGLTGRWLAINDQFTGRARPGVTPQVIQRALRTNDMWKIPDHIRGSVYIYLQKQVKDFVRTHFRQQFQEYMTAVQEFKFGKWESDSVILKEAKIIGMTTTALSKYRPLVASLSPKIILIEEAAETLEGLVTAGCVESLQHLILVG